LFFLAIYGQFGYNQLTMVKRISIAIDGSNFYHRLKEPQVDLHNLLEFDYAAFAKWLANKKKVVSQNYYIGAVRAKPKDKKAQKLRRNQQKLFSHLEKSGWKIERGFILKTGRSFHEKGVDVKIAVDIVVGAYENLYDRLILVSSDTDLLPALEVVRRRGKEIEYVGFSHAPSHAMIEYATETRLLRKDDLVPFVCDERL
jgi:uncharacterized LabA/DUF88 family protein